VFNKLAEALEVPKAKLRSADRFKVELAPLKGKWGEVDDSDFSVHVLFDVLTRKHGIHAHFDSIETVSDFINLFCRK
jgi:hypothetical protein